MSKRKKSGFLVVALFAVLIYMFYIAIGQQKLLYAKSIEKSKLEEKVREEMKIIEELKKEKKTIDSDEYIEKVAREVLGMVKENERVFVDIGQ